MTAEPDRKSCAPVPRRRRGTSKNLPGGSLPQTTVPLRAGWLRAGWLRTGWLRAGWLRAVPPRTEAVPLVVLLLWAASCLWASSADPADLTSPAPANAGPAAFFRAGVAVRVVTPDPLLSVSGGMGPASPTRRKLGELTVRALALEDSDTRVAIVSTDFLGFPAVLGDRVRAAVEGISPENILLAATHTHSAPDCYGFPDGKGGHSADLDYLEWVCTRAAEAIRAALADLQPAAVRMATGEARGRIAYNYYAEHLYDPRCHVVQVVDPAGKPIATLINYAVHPEVLGSEQGVVSPDLVGPLCDRIEGRGGGVGIFVNGALGGMVTADCRGPDGRDIRSWAECIRIGHLLADEALRIVASAPAQSSPELRCFARTVTFPVDSPPMQAVLRSSPLGHAWRRTHDAASTGDTATVTTRLNLVTLGNARILTIPGEALPNIGYFLKRKMGGDHNLLFGLTNDAFGYILTRVDFNSFRRYEYVTRTSLGEMTGEIFIEEALRLIEESSGEGSP